MQEYRPFRALSVSDTKPQSISMHQHIRTNECPTTAIQSDNNPSHHRPSANPFGFIHYMGMGEPFRATLLQSPGWRECQRHEQNPGYTHGQKIRAPQERHFRRAHLSYVLEVPPLQGLSSTNLKSRLVRRTCFRRTQTNKKSIAQSLKASGDESVDISLSDKED